MGRYGKSDLLAVADVSYYRIFCVAYYILIRILIKWIQLESTLKKVFKSKFRYNVYM